METTTITYRKFRQLSHEPLLALRLMTLAIMVIYLYVHLRSLRIFRWELLVTGGLLVSYFISTIGLTLWAPESDRGTAPIFQAYLCGVGALLFILNAVVLWRQWQRCSDLTRVVADLLDVLGVPLQRQVLIKVSLSVVAAVSLLADFIFAPLLNKLRIPIAVEREVVVDVDNINVIT